MQLDIHVDTGWLEYLSKAIRGQNRKKEKFSQNHRKIICTAIVKW